MIIEWLGARGTYVTFSALLRSLCTLRYFVFVIFRNKVQTSQKIQEECFTYSSKSTCKNSGTFEGKQILPEKVTYVPLAPSHSISEVNVSCFPEENY